VTSAKWLFVSAGVAALHACSRQADVRDELQAPFKPPPMVKADVHEVDSGLGTDAFPGCAQRSLTPGCAGPTDLPCSFTSWVPEVAKRCDRETGCKTNGTVEVRMNAEGCVSSILMDDPNDEFVECVAREFGAARCQCGEGVASHFFGLGNAGCTTCSREFPCPIGSVCRSGTCVPATDAG
jgi:hypothetical protein